MGNRAVITTKENMYNNGVAIYLHWNGGRDSVEAFLEYGKLKGLHMDDYGFARLTQIISNFFGGTLSIGVNVFNHTDYDNMDNGTYIVDNDLNIIERRFAPMFEQNTYDKIDMLLEIDRKQPQNERFGKDFLTSELVKANELKIGDKLIKCDGNEINDILDIKKVVNNKNVGDYVNFEVLRDDVLIEANLKVDYNHLLGIAMVTNYEYELSDDIDIKFKNSEGGSSGGLMLSLAIYQEKSGIDIVKGRKIAGTGTIDIDGNVGEIDGIKYKIIGANNDKMDIVLVPGANYEEAKKVVEDNNYKLKLVKINTFEEAIDYLSK